MFRFYLNGTELTNPIDGFEEFTVKISRSIADRRMILKYPTDLVFTGDGFNILYDAIESQGYDAVFEFLATRTQMDGEAINEFNGLIFLIDVEFDLTRRTATTKVKENSYLARLWSNLKNPVSLPSLKTKNGFYMLPQSRVSIDFQDSLATPNYINDAGTVFNNTPAHAGLRNGVNVPLALKEIIENISDGNVSLNNKFFDQQAIDRLTNWNTDDTPLMLIRGRELRLGDDRTSNRDIDIKISFDDLFRAVSRLYNLYLYPSTQTANPTVVIGSESDFFPNEQIVEIESPENMTMSYFQELFYSTVRMGSGKYLFQDGNTNANLPQVPFETFQQEDYYLSGLNNIDNRYDLSVSKLIIDNNIIRDVLADNTDNYDDDYFLIQYVAERNVPAVYGAFGTYTFNGALMSNRVATRHNLFGRITANLTQTDIDNRLKFESDQSNKYVFFAPKNNQTYFPTFTPSFANPIFDLSGGKFDGEKYTAEVSGQYTFDTNIVVNVTQLEFMYYDPSKPLYVPSFDTVQCEINLVIKDGANVVQAIPINSNKLQNIAIYQLKASTTVSMNANETAELTINFVALNDQGYYTQGRNPHDTLNDITFWYSDKSVFECTATPDANLSYETPTAGSFYRGTRILVEYYLNQKQIKDLIDNPNYSVKLLNFVETGNEKPCWINDLEINTVTGELTAELITNIANEQEVQRVRPRQTQRRQPTTCDNEILCFANEVNSQYISAI